jgi:hypothetical protein
MTLRASLIDGVRLTGLGHDFVPLAVLGLVVVPAGLVAFGLAERYAKRTGTLERVG